MMDLEKQRQAVQKGALLQQASDLGTLIVTGKDRQTWLNGLVTCEIAALRPGDGAYGLAVAKNGKILSELRFIIEKDRVLIGLSRAHLAMMQEHLDRHLIMEDAEMEDVSGEHEWLLVHGPRAKDLVEVAKKGGLATAKIDATGLGGGAIVVPGGKMDTTISTLLETLSTEGAVATEASWDILRVELGFPKFGIDFDDQNYPQEARLEKLAVSFQKGCYLGQETVFMLQMRGHVKKKLVPLSIDGLDEPAIGAEISLPEGGAAIGHLTSRVPSPAGDGWLGLGYVKYKNAEPDSELSIAGRKVKVLGKSEAATE